MFYPDSIDEVRKMFVVMGKKSGVTIKPEDVPDTGGKKRQMRPWRRPRP
jgi:hypothetical protein